MSGISISNHDKEKHRFLDRNTERAIGLIEMDHYRHASNIVFGTFQREDMRGLDPERFLAVLIVFLNDLLIDLWLVKDHCVECDSAYLAVPKKGQEVQWSTNYSTARPSLATGALQKPVTLSCDELEKWAAVHDAVRNYLSTTNSSDRTFMLDKSVHRSGRAMQFIHAARISTNLAYRISHYCSALETLFSNDAAELSHKLSERTAFFLSAHGFNRREVFRKIKQAYTVRSKLTHGDILKQKQIDELPEISCLCDVYLRTIMNAIFGDERLREIFDVKRDAVETYFEEMILGR